MPASNLHLSKIEFEILSEPSWHLHKHATLQKILALLHRIGNSLQSIQHPSQLAVSNQYKISKGENFELMPYQVLDFPQIADANFPFLLRTVVWWGHHISIQFFFNKEFFSPSTLFAIMQKTSGYRMLTGNNLWQQNSLHADFVEIPDNKKIMEKLIAQLSHLKISRTISFGEIERLEEEIIKDLEMVYHTIKVQLGS
jgi:hypothetical protein